MEYVDALLQSLEGSAPAIYIAESAWAFPAIETIHVLAGALTVGTVFFMDLRLLGLASVKQRYAALRREVLPWAWLAFGVAVVSGFLMFISQATEYFANDAFRTKLILLLLAGVNMMIFELIVARDAGDWDARARRSGKFAALLSLALWVSIVFFGRRVGFTMNFG